MDSATTIPRTSPRKSPRSKTNSPQKSHHPNESGDASNISISSALNGSYAESLADSFDGSRTEELQIPACELKSDPKYEKRFIVVSDEIESVTIYPLKHPRYEARALYHIDANGTAEVLEFDAGERSAFVGDSVTNTQINIIAPIHPFFLVLPYVLKALNTLLKDESYPAAQLLGELDSVKRTVGNVCDLKGSTFSLNKDKLNEWLKNRFDWLIEGLKNYNGLPDVLKSDVDHLRFEAFDIFADFIPKSLAETLKQTWRIAKPERSSSVESNASKRKMEAPKVDAKTAAKQRKLAEASKLSQNIGAFFKKLPAKEKTSPKKTSPKKSKK